VFASGKDRRDPRTELHSNFKLDANGDFIALVARDGTSVLRQFPSGYPVTKTFPRQPKNVSYGIGSDGSIGFFRLPTPGAVNGLAFAGVVADIVGHQRGFYDTNITIEIATETSGAAIRIRRTTTPAPTAVRFTQRRSRPQNHCSPRSCLQGRLGANQRGDTHLRFSDQRHYSDVMSGDHDEFCLWTRCVARC
jgi:hypothetical protein